MESAPTTFPRFQELPEGIKRKIYKLLLTVGIFYMPGRRWDPRPKRQIRSTLVQEIVAPLFAGEDGSRRYSSMLKGKKEILHEMELSPLNMYTPGLIQGVSKKVQTEAEQVFLSYNQFIVPAGIVDSPVEMAPWNAPCADILKNLNFKRGYGFASFVKDLSIAFDSRDASMEIGLLEARAEVLDEWEREGRTFENEESKMVHLRDSIHDVHVRNITDIWWFRMLNLQFNSQLDRLEIDVSACYCPAGCCRLLEHAFAFKKSQVIGFWFKAAPKIVEVIGCQDETERTIMLKSLVMTDYMLGLPPSGNTLGVVNRAGPVKTGVRKENIVFK
ncbi:hypothetical protein GGR54DRAFT_607298 [Hypoxylon sp. NC1633]|nr:hypothetical protein GGR54DRAFT_607298 [Hypoxylon sp. NC1633]